MMSHDAKPGARVRCNQALRALAAAQRREAQACDRLADHNDAAAQAADFRALALRDAPRASAKLAAPIADLVESGRTRRQSEIFIRQSSQASAESSSNRMRARVSRAQGARARAQAAC